MVGSVRCTSSGIQVNSTALADGGVTRSANRNGRQRIDHYGCWSRSKGAVSGIRKGYSVITGGIRGVRSIGSAGNCSTVKTPLVGIVCAGVGLKSNRCTLADGQASCRSNACKNAAAIAAEADGTIVPRCIRDYIRLSIGVFAIPGRCKIPSKGMGTGCEDDKANLEECSVEVNGIEVKPSSAELGGTAEDSAVGKQAGGDEGIDIGC